MTELRVNSPHDPVKRHTLKVLSWGIASWLCGLEANAKSDSLKVGFLNNYLPFSYLDPQGQLKGFDVEVVTRLAQVLNLKIEFVTAGMVQLNQQLKANELMLIGNQLLATPENRREFDFVKPYANLQMVSVLHEDDPRDFLSLEDFFGKKLGVLKSTGVEMQARNVIGKSVVAFERIEDALKALADKKLDAVLEESLIVEYFIERDNLPVKVGAPFAAPVNVGLVVKKSNQEMQAKLNTAVQTILKDGSFKAISTRWFGYDVSRARAGHAMGS